MNDKEIARDLLVAMMERRVYSEATWDRAAKNDDLASWVGRDYQTLLRYVRNEDEASPEYTS